MFRWCVLLNTCCAGVVSGEEAVQAFRFKTPHSTEYSVSIPGKGTLRAASGLDWLKVSEGPDDNRRIEIGNRVILGVEAGVNVSKLLSGTALIRARDFAPNIVILQAPDALSAALAAERFAGLDSVWLSHPERKFHRPVAGRYASPPNDPYFSLQWYLEHRNGNGNLTGPGLNVRAAWPFSRGEGVVVAVGDDGVELSHPEFVNAAAGQPHFNFENGTPNGNPVTQADIHSTAVAGLILAEGQNGIGMTGVAPAAKLVSWKILSATETALSDMFQYQSNVVSVQNHSWVLASRRLAGPSVVELVGLSNALTHGRQGRGTVMTRAGGNDREAWGNVNDDGFINDPRVVAVAAVRNTGRVAAYSNPGACLLVSAASGDTGFPTLFTTDRQGALGYNQIGFANDFANYAFDSTGFTGTSGSAPQIAGLVALLLSANPNLTIRDVQLILALSARQFDFSDPAVFTNRAGLLFSHNTGYGVPDAGEAMQLALHWSNRPPIMQVNLVSTNVLSIPDQGTYARATGVGVPTNLFSITGEIVPDSLDPEPGPQFGPGENLRPNPSTLTLPLTFVGQATNAIAIDLAGKGALIERGIATFSEKIKRVEDAGAAFAIIFNNDTNAPEELIQMGLTQRTDIISIFIGQTNGLALRDLVATNSELRAQIVMEGPLYEFTITNQMICEHVGVRIKTSHTFRSDLRITLESPSGTLSILARRSYDVIGHGSGPADWTYYSTANFLEPTAGHWKVRIVDEDAGGSGSVFHAELILRGVPIEDADSDGLDDAWEMSAFGNLAEGPLGDPDKDGYINSREQVMGTNPAALDSHFVLNQDLSVWNDQLARVSWPGSTNFSYELQVSDSVTNAFTLATNVMGRFPTTEAFVPYASLTNRIFRVRATPVP